MLSSVLSFNKYLSIMQVLLDSETSKTRDTKLTHPVACHAQLGSVIHLNVYSHLCFLNRLGKVIM
jgi:hypothetical protein